MISADICVHQEPLSINHSPLQLQSIQQLSSRKHQSKLFKIQAPCKFLKQTPGHPSRPMQIENHPSRWGSLSSSKHHRWSKLRRLPFVYHPLLSKQKRFIRSFVDQIFPERPKETIILGSQINQLGKRSKHYFKAGYQRTTGSASSVKRQSPPPGSGWVPGLLGLWRT